MAPVYSCLRCGYATDHLGDYNKHINKYSKSNSKKVEQCLLCAKQCKVGGSTLRKHACLADMLLESFEQQYVMLNAVCEELSPVPDNDFEQMGLASDQPEDLALAAFQLLFLSPKHPDYQNIPPCQHNSGKLSVVLPIKRGATHVVNTQKCGWHYQRLMCLMVTLIDIQYLVC